MLHSQKKEHSIYPLGGKVVVSSLLIVSLFSILVRTQSPTQHLRQGPLGRGEEASRREKGFKGSLNYNALFLLLPKKSPSQIWPNVSIC